MSIVRANFAWYDAMIYALTITFLDATNSKNRIEIYEGTMPIDADSWTQGGIGSPANLLLTVSNFNIRQNTQTGYIIDVQEAVFGTAETPNPGTLNATATGTAAWYAMYDEDSWDFGKGVLLGDVSLSGGNGTLHLDSLDLQAGLPVQILHWGMKFTNP